MSKAIKYRQATGHKTRIVDGEAFVISPEKIRHFNATATVIWLILSKPTTSKELVEILSQIYPTPVTQLQRDARQSLRLFENYKMIQRV